jgi:DNA-binding NarL/FixJ family response regulator
MTSDNTSQAIQILIVDDHQMFLDGIKNLLVKEKNLHVTAEANTGKEALDILAKIPVDLVITDINMPVMSGTELTKQIKKDYPHIKVLVLTMYNDREIIHEIVMTEAEGYILKNSNKKELLNAISRIADHGTYYSNEVISIMTENFISKEKIRDKTQELSSREKEVILLICQEFTTAEIAIKLFLSPLTVETHRKNILRKTNSKTIVGLIKFAIDNKLAG